MNAAPMLQPAPATTLRKLHFAAPMPHLLNTKCCTLLQGAAFALKERAGAPADSVDRGTVLNTLSPTDATKCSIQLHWDESPPPLSDRVNVPPATRWVAGLAS